MSELNRVLASKKKRSAAGEDALTYNMLNNLPPEGKEELLGIFNSIWEKGDIPKTFKTAIVIPIVKPDQPEDVPSSYRPIALTSHVGKTLEALVSNRLNKYLETNNILNKNQAGFRNKRQALEMIAKLEMEVREAQNTKQEVISAFIDISKAFDQCSREIVLKHLKEAKVTGQMYNYVQNFLKDRVFKVKVGNELSDALIQENGIPQGSIISPTLFLLSINKVNEQITKSTSLGQFADDTAIWKRYSISRRSRESAIEEFERDLGKVVRHLTSIGYKVNEKKTQIVIFNRPKRDRGEVKVNVGKQVVNNVTEAKYLGVTLDEDLTFKTHMENLVKKGKKINGPITYSKR